MFVFWYFLFCWGHSSLSVDILTFCNEEWLPHFLSYYRQQMFVRWFSFWWKINFKFRAQLRKHICIHKCVGRCSENRPKKLLSKYDCLKALNLSSRMTFFGKNKTIKWRHTLLVWYIDVYFLSESAKKNKYVVSFKVISDHKRKTLQCKMQCNDINDTIIYE